MKTNLSFSIGLFFLVNLLLNHSLAQAKNYWMSTANMLHARQDHSATLLPNGKVLIFGWESNEAELYDPEGGTFSATGNLVYNRRQGATATLLNNGKVLVVGGANAQQLAELYDPESGNFELTDSLNTIHGFHTATLLLDGRVLIAGGQDQNGPQTLADCEIYDPQSGTFSPTGSLNEDRSCHTATLLPNGQVLVVGGIQTTTPGNGIYLDACELYEPGDGQFRRIQNLNQPRTGHQATRLNNGKVLISCGAWYQRYGELYDYTTNTWTMTGEMTVIRRNYHTATLLETGRVLLAGGFKNAATASAELYDPFTNRFIAIDSMITARMEHTATRLSDGNVLVTGGYSSSGAVNLAEVCIIDTLGIAGVSDKGNHNSPKSFKLLQNYPNPFNPATTIQFQIPVLASVELSIYAVNGRKVRTLLNRHCNAGTHSLTWNGLDDSGRQVSSGIYIYRLESKGIHETKKMHFLK